MLNVGIIANDQKNNWLVDQFETYYGKSSHTKNILFIPREAIFIVFHFKNRPSLVDNNEIQLEPYFVAPIIPKSILLNFSGLFDTLVVTCKATVFSRTFNLDLSPISKRSISLPKPVFHALWKKMAAQNSIEERIHCFTEFINSHQQTMYVPDAIDAFYNKIIEKSLHTSLGEIMKDCFISKSTIHRKFIKRTGVSPKTLARIVRLNHLLARIRKEKAVDYQDLVFDGNYFDQSHFINDFKFIVGETPSDFFKSNPDIAKSFT